MKLHFKAQDITIQGYDDVDWKNDQQSISCYLFKVYGSIVSRRSQKQSTISLSSIEAEFVALANAISEALWFQGLLSKLEKEIRSIEMFEDNQSCIQGIKQPRQHQQMKHLDIKYSFLPDAVTQDIIQLSYLSTEDQIADIFKKSLPGSMFLKLRLTLGLLI